MALANTRQLRSQGLVSVEAHRTEGVTGSGGREGANGVGRWIRVGGGNGDGNGVGGGSVDGAGAGTGTGAEVDKGAQDGSGDGAGAGTGAGAEVNKGAQDGNGDESGDGAGTGTGAGVETCRLTQDGNGGGTRTEAKTVAEFGAGTRTTGTETRIGSGRAKESRRSARNRKIVVDAMWETVDTWVERSKNVEKKGLVQ